MNIAGIIVIHGTENSARPCPQATLKFKCCV